MKNTFHKNAYLILDTLRTILLCQIHFLLRANFQTISHAIDGKLKPEKKLLFTELEAH